MRDSLRHFVSEFVGTFALVFVGSGVLIVAKIPNSGIGLIEIAAAHGLIFAVMVTALMRVSGHFNPAVTLGFLATRRIGGIMCGVYILAQLLAAMVAAYALKGLTPADLYEVARGGGQSISLDISGAQATVLEAIATFFLVWTVFGTAVDTHAPKVGGFAIGLTITAGMLAIGPLTGGSMNPARSFGPAVVIGQFEGQAAYWIGPLLGGIVAALLYDRVFIPREPEPADHGTVSPAT